MGDASTFTIKEATGKKRRLDLRGRALPYRPYSLKGKMRAEFTWYPGNAVASVQLLGASEDGTTIKGQWKDRFIRSEDDNGNSVNPTGIATLDGRQVEDCMALVNAVDSFRMGGQLVEVTWDEITRVGIITDFAPTWNQREWVEWELSFGWVSRGEKESPITFAKPPDATDFANQMSNLVTQLSDIVVPTFNLAQSFVDKIYGFATTISNTVNELEDLTFQVSNQVLTLSEAGSSTLACAETLKSASASIISLLGATPLRAMRNATTGTAQTFGEVLETDVWQRSVKGVVREIETTAAEKGDTLRATVNQTDLLATFVARAPTDLRDVSLIYYDTPNEWRRLMQYNGLSSSKLARGALVQVPKLGYDDRSA